MKFRNGNHVKTLLVSKAGAALTIPSLLLADLFRGSSILTSLDELRLTGEDKIDGRNTFKVEGKFQGRTVKLWIDQREFLILKIHRKMKFGGFEAERGFCRPT